MPAAANNSPDSAMERSDSPSLWGYEFPPEGQLPARDPAAGTARTMNRCGAGPT
jgi:hypothetical protein